MWVCCSCVCVLGGGEARIQQTTQLAAGGEISAEFREQHWNHIMLSRIDATKAQTDSVFLLLFFLIKNLFSLMLFQWWHQWVTWWQCQQIYTHIPAPPHPKWLQHRTWVTLHDCNTQEIWLIPIRCTALPVSDVLNVHCVLCLWVGEFIVGFFLQ